MPVRAPGGLSRLPLMGDSRYGRCLTEDTALMTSGILAGAFVLGRYGLRPATTQLPVQTHVAVRQALIRSLHLLMPRLMVATIGSSFMAAIAARGSTARRIGLASAVLPLVLTRFGNVPLNDQMLTWTPAAPPSDWRSVVDRWDRFDTLRTLAAIATFVCQVLACHDTHSDRQVQHA